MFLSTKRFLSSFSYARQLLTVCAGGWRCAVWIKLPISGKIWKKHPV